MANQLCFSCFKMKGEFNVCPHCGYVDEAAELTIQLAPGTVLLDRYIIGMVVGLGGFGITYKAFDTTLNIIIAVKEFYPSGLVHRAGDDLKVSVFSGQRRYEYNKYLKRFLDEARNLAIFSKEKDIVNVYDYFEENDTAYIIMEFLQGILLKDRLQQEPKLSLAEAKSYMISILEALEKIHLKGIIHKDISPDNIYLLTDNTVKIFDFGAAKLQDDNSEARNETIVKPGYTPPEQYYDGPQGAYSDVYAAGAVFYEMITGVRPIESTDRMADVELLYPSAYHQRISKELEEHIMKAIAVEPEQRFATATQFKQALGKSKKISFFNTVRKNKLRRWRPWFGVAAVCAAAAIFLVMRSMAAERNYLNPNPIKSTEITVWLVERGDTQKVTQMLTNSLAKRTDAVNLKVEFIPERNYQERLEKALIEDTMPDLFCTDYLVSDIKKVCADLFKMTSVMDHADYVFENDPEKSCYELPLTWQVGLLYKNTAKKENQKLFYGDDPEVFTQMGDPSTEVSTVVGDLSILKEVRTATVEKLPPVNYSVEVYLDGQKPIGCYSDYYGISAASSKNDLRASMQVLYLLLGTQLQDYFCVAQDYALPVNREVLTEFQKFKATTYLSFLTEYEPENIVFLEERDICNAIRGGDIND